LKSKDYKYLFIILCCCVIVACASSKAILKKPQIITVSFAKKQPLTKEEKQNWHFKDIYTDSIPGISLDKAYQELLKNKQGNTIIVAVVDTELDIDHEDLKKQIWVNKDEIPNNHIDDDDNGYIDDINGWNFIANNHGESTKYLHFSSVRIIKKFDSLFKNKSMSDFKTKKDVDNYKIYKRAKKQYNFLVKQAIQDIDYIKFLEDNYSPAHKLVYKYFPNKDYTISQLDSLYKLKDSKGDKKEAALIYYVADFMKYNLSKEWMQKYRRNADAKIDKILNLDTYNEREIIGDNPNDLNDSIYGGNNVIGIVKESYHSTQVTGVLLSGMAKYNLKIMPVCISTNGDELDKDIAIAIHYAVNNGAKVINMSFGKEFSLNQKWVSDAFKYAENNGVLIVSSAGNESTNLATDGNNHYPNDEYNNKEVVNNFIKVAASSYKVNENLAAVFTNYGKDDIDIFAPGVEIYTTQPNDKYIFNRGTSLAAPIVSKIAALIFSYYPNLTAPEVKQIIVESGVSYNIMVNKPSTNKEKELVPFISLSKSGKIVNAYNALLLAEEVSKKKKK